MQFRIPTLDNYNSFVGVFITNFAETEWLLRHLLYLNSSLTSEQFNEWVGWPRYSQLTKQLKKIVKSQYNKEVLGEIEDLIKRLDDIADLRNRVVHYGGHIVDNELVIRTYKLQPSEKTGQSFDIVQQDNLERAVTDLQKISWILSVYLDPTRAPEDQEFMNNSLSSLLPWKYEAI